ncbi:uncharacterized protein SPSK_06612 [Sporothrix schenckii 1099-18]|uniref:Altered inheritance of mitochondria protein 13, mitochondrial n=2 Tax=Sporothrix schenckii TaxID=29908 RepID=U7PTZ8_SPOS1|nr:uncharacterized protein SPSK_06612 [Sporothrix schenckii 1099-18]ERS98391.1 hypothetical protein HMPREF1624_05175 [Sporothrix schenckii ATCC 58251]KJR89473.1 hypothetical protein SPSK_06612 [Sporothrix schenckii 1099-18]
MGSSASKPNTPHVWKGSNAPAISQDMIDSLQSSTETDVTRAQTLELHIQARVTDELRRLQAEQLAKLKGLEQAIDDETAASTPSDSTTSASVSKEIAGLRARLEARQRDVARPLPEPVEAARSEVIRCLREHDRRPLDCYREVAAFKEEVRKLEATWVDRVVS